jgi:hypothetical protein
MRGADMDWSCLCEGERERKRGREDERGRDVEIKGVSESTSRRCREMIKVNS